MKEWFESFILAEIFLQKKEEVLFGNSIVLWVNVHELLKQKLVFGHGQFEGELGEPLLEFFESEETSALSVEHVVDELSLAGSLEPKGLGLDDGNDVREGEGRSEEEKVTVENFRNFLQKIRKIVVLGELLQLFSPNHSLLLRVYFLEELHFFLELLRAVGKGQLYFDQEENQLRALLVGNDLLHHFSHGHRRHRESLLLVQLQKVGMLKNLGNSQPLVWVLLEHSDDQVLRFGRYVEPFEVDWLVKDLLDHFEGIFLFVGKLTGEHFVQTDSHAPNVTLDSVAVLFDDFRRDIVGSSNHGKQHFLVDLPGESEVDDFDVVGVGAFEDDVFELQVSVGDFAVVHETDPKANLVENVSRAFFWKLAVFNEVVVETHSLAELLHDVVFLGREVDLAKTDQVGMVEFAENLELSVEVIRSFFAVVDNFDRELLFGKGLVGGVSDDSKLTNADLFVQLVDVCDGLFRVGDSHLVEIGLIRDLGKLLFSFVLFMFRLSLLFFQRSAVL